MASSDDHHPESTRPSGSAISESPVQTKPSAAAKDEAGPALQPAGPAVAKPETTAPAHPIRKKLLIAAILIGLVIAGYFLVPTVATMLNTVSTDDAYVNGHVTYVAPRVQGQVLRVLVDDNYRVKKGDLLVELDKEPYQVQVAIKKAAVASA